MNSKKFTLIITTILFIFVSTNALIWNLSTKHILTRENQNIVSGDLARMGYLYKFAHFRKNDTNLTKVHFEASNYKMSPIDMITIGDSFSQGVMGGPNRYYQDFIATKLNLNILNILNYKQHSKIETLAILANSGFFKKIGVKYVLVEITQRGSVKELTGNINYKADESIPNIEKFYKFGNNDTNNEYMQLPKTSFINNGNFKYLLFNILYHFSDHAIFSKVYMTSMIEDFFSVGPDNKLLFYNNDLKSIRKNNQSNLSQINKNLNKLQKILKKQNIKLIYMPVVTKYDLYSKFIKDNPYPKDLSFEIYNKLKKDYIFIDTKKILLKKLDKHKQDIFYVDDTHWTYKASDAISDEIKSLLQPDV